MKDEDRREFIKGLDTGGLYFLLSPGADITVQLLVCKVLTKRVRQRVDVLVLYVELEGVVIFNKILTG